tara:strand:- start:287 stop:787 length:501 start_codon:yes stop_codon:yes gene_type:complete
MKNQKILIRKALKSDAKFILNTYNHGVRNLKFINKNLVNFKSHIFWFNKNLNKENVLIYIAIKSPGLRRVAYTRFEKIKSETWEISIATNPLFFGKGFGTILLKKTLNKFKGKSKFIAIVRNDNKASIKIFLKNKFIKKKNKRYLVNKKISLTSFSYFELNKSIIS